MESGQGEAVGGVRMEKFKMVFTESGKSDS